MVKKDIVPNEQLLELYVSKVNALHVRTYPVLFHLATEVFHLVST